MLLLLLCFVFHKYVSSPLIRFLWRKRSAQPAVSGTEEESTTTAAQVDAQVNLPTDSEATEANQDTTEVSEPLIEGDNEEIAGEPDDVDDADNADNVGSDNDGAEVGGDNVAHKNNRKQRAFKEDPYVFLLGDSPAIWERIQYGLSCFLSSFACPVF
jgi:hypothetical protein